MPETPAANASLTPEPGHLYVVATPIGNMADLSERARALLAAVDLIACEDTRTTGGLLNRLGIKQPMVPYHDHNETNAADALVRELESGKSVALVCDAGTPGLSDPGFRLTRACQKNGLPVVPIPGASALTAVLCAAGLPTNGFFYRALRELPSHRQTLGGHRYRPRSRAGGLHRQGSHQATRNFFGRPCRNRGSTIAADESER